MNHGSLFSGIGGFDLAAEWMGWNNRFHCEWNEFGQKVLKYYWPNAESYGDITKTDFTIWRGKIDILTGGFPCQPYSSAGKRLGKEDDRHLWPEMLRAIGEISPRYVVGENVRGLTNWNGGLVFEEVQADLEAKGYEVTSFLLPACAVNAPHRRDRIWFIAHRNICTKGSSGESGEIESYRSKNNDDPSGGRITGKQYSGCGEFLRSTSNPSDSRLTCPEKLGFVTETRYMGAGGHGGSRTLANSYGLQRCEGRMHPTGSETTERYSCSCDACRHERNTWNEFPTQPPVCSGNDGLSARLDGITFSKWRNESIKAAGNAIVPQVALQIFKAIEQYENRL